MSELTDLLTFRILSARNGNQKAITQLMGEAANRIADLERALREIIVAVETCDGTAQIDLTDAKKALGL